MTESKKPGRRLLVARLAAHVAYLLNEKDGEAAEDVVALRPFALFQALLQTLASQKYREGLAGAAVIGLADDPELAAQRYFEAVFERPLFLARANPWHKGHELFLAICRRGWAQGWTQGRLVRHLAPPPDGQGPEGFETVRGRLERLDGSIAKGNPARKTRENNGPLHLAVLYARAEIAEQMSLWEALSCGPERLVRLAEKREFDKFCSLLIRALEAANAPYGAFVSLGLPPLDWGKEWGGEITTNTARMALRFINEAKAMAKERGKEGHDAAIWAELWERRKVPGFGSADEFWGSGFGRALRHPPVPQFAQGDEFAAHQAEEPSLMNERDFLAVLEWCEENDRLEAFDLWFLRKIVEGETITGMTGHEKVRAHFGKVPSDEQIEAYAEALYERILIIARSHFGEDGKA